MSDGAGVELEALVADICRIAEIPAPTFHEEPRADWIAVRLAGAPGRVHRDPAGNVIWAWGEGPPELLVTAHIDTVFPASTRLGLERSDGRLVGPGAGDNAAAIAVAIHVVEDLLGRRPLRPGAVAFTVGEEGLGDLRGAREAVARLRPGAVLALEGHGLEAVVTRAHGSLRARIAVSGPGGHAWGDRGRPSAIHELVGIANGLLGWSSAEEPVNIGLIDGGISVNAIAAEASLVVEKRASAEPDLAAFRSHLEQLRLDPPLAVEVTVLGHRPAGEIDPEARLLQVVLSVREALELPGTLLSGSTDANAGIGAGIPSLSLGVSLGENMHTIGESIEIGSLDLGARQLRLVIEELLA